MGTLERRWRARVAAAVAACVLLGLAWGCATSQAFQNGNKAAKSGDWDLAVTYYRKAVQGAPDRSDYKIVLERAMLAAARGHIAEGQKFEQEDQLDFALRAYRKSLEYDGANQEVRAKIQVIEQTLRDRIEASRPRPPIEALREKARQAMAEPILNPASREPLKIKFANQQLRDILNFIGSATGINVAFDRDFQDKQYSVDLDGVTLEQALHQILTANQFFFKVLNERTIIVVPETQPKRLAYEEQAIRTFYLSHADPTEMVQLLNTVVRLQQPIQPVFGPNKNNNTVTVRATIPMLQIIERVIEANDRPRAEVIIDVEILEVNRDRAKQYGLELSQYAVGLAFSPEAKPSSGSGTEGASSGGGAFNLNTVSAGISAADFYASVPSAAIRFLESDSETKVVAKPQLRGSEGEKLTLNLGTEVPVPSTTFTPIATGGTAYNPLTSFQYKTVGVNVEIEPRVTYEGDIVMKLSVEVSAQAGDKNIAGQNLPSFGTRKATTRLRLRDGESNLLAGLLQEVERKSIKGVPGLIHVPILKDLFASNDNRIEQTDIVMLLTPHIVRTHQLTERDLGPIYIGTQQSLGLTGAPPLIAPPAGGEPEAAAPAPAAAAPGAPRLNPAPPAAGSPVPAPPGSTTVPVVPPGSSPIPGTVGMPAAPPVAAPAQPAAALPAAVAPEPPIPAAAPPQPAPPAPVSPAVISVATPGADLMVAGGPYTVPIAIANASRLSTVTVSLSYNPRVLKVRLVQEGSFMRQGGVTVQFAQHVDDQTGRVDVTFTRVSDSVGASGAGMLAAIVFDAVSTGTSSLSVNGAATGPAGAAATLAFQPATVTVR